MAGGMVNLPLTPADHFLAQEAETAGTVIDPLSPLSGSLSRPEDKAAVTTPINIQKAWEARRSNSI